MLSLCDCILLTSDSENTAPLKDMVIFRVNTDGVYNGSLVSEGKPLELQDWYSDMPFKRRRCNLDDQKPGLLGQSHACDAIQ